MYELSTVLRCLSRRSGRDGKEELRADHQPAGTASPFAATGEEEEQRERVKRTDQDSHCSYGLLTAV